MHLAHHIHINAHFLDGPGCALGGHQAEFQLGEGLGQLLHFRLVLISHREKHATLGRHVQAGAHHGLVKGTGIMVVDAHDLASGFHLGAKGNIHIRHLRKGEDRSLDRHIGARRHQSRVAAQLGQGRPHGDAGGQVHHLDIGDFGQEGHCTGRTGVDLDDVDFTIGDYELDVQQSLDMQGAAQALGVVDNGINDAAGQGLGG